MIYGATGYTGRLVARDAKDRGYRRSSPEQAAKRPRSRRSSGCRRAVFSLFDVAATRRALDGMSVVAHCAGPFAATSAPMLDACLLARTHYVDITGEIDVFVAAQAPAQRGARRRHRRVSGRRLRRDSHRLRGGVPRRGAARRDASRARLSGAAARAVPGPRARRSKACGTAPACARTAPSSPSRSGNGRA